MICDLKSETTVSKLDLGLSVAAVKGIARQTSLFFGCSVICQICAPAWISSNQADTMRAGRREHLLAQRAAICDKRWFHPPLDRAGDDSHLSPHSSVLLNPHYSFTSSRRRLTCMERAHPNTLQQKRIALVFPFHLRRSRTHTAISHWQGCDYFFHLEPDSNIL